MDERGESPLATLRGLPVIDKLRLLDLDSDGEYLMDKAHERIAEMQNLLHTV